MDQKPSVKQITGETTLRRPIQIVKKSSGPLDNVINEVNSSKSINGANDKNVSDVNISSQKQKIIRSSLSPPLVHRKQSTKEKEKKRERWLLTRKTWKYMTDAGKKLIPDNIQNRKEDIHKIEEHFNQVCATEPRFILWRRKGSFPGASRTSKRRLKLLRQHTGAEQKHLQNSALVKQEEINNLNRIIDLLQSYLKLNESFKTTMLLDSKTVRPDKTSSPSAQRPTDTKHDYSIDFSQYENKNLSQLDEIEQRLRALLGSTNYSATLIPKNISRNTVEDKALMKQIYYTLKKQQMHRLLSNHSSTAHPKTRIMHSVSLSNISPFFSPNDSKKFQNSFEGNTILTQSNYSDSIQKTQHFESKGLENSLRQKQPPSSLNLRTIEISDSHPKKLQPKKYYNSCGSQTNFIQLQEIKRLAEEYKIQKREEDMNSPPGTSTATDDEDNYNYRRKSSIDNEDVSQSVSDTIKRYLRMARKKSVHDDNPSRFKRVNYDRNLRNIRAKGEINPPGIDENNDKATQTLDAWPLITLEFIRGNENSSILETAHVDWQKALEQRIQKKQEYEQKIKCSQTTTNIRSDCKQKDFQQPQQQLHKQSVSSCSSSSAPTSPTSDTKTCTTNNGSGILHSSTQFLSNLWHGTTPPITNNQQNNENTSTVKTQHLLNTIQYQPNQSKSTMQKSKSSSNVGHFVSRKILRSRSKSQTRSTNQVSSPKWTPTDKLKWISENGGELILKETSLIDLFDIEAKALQGVAIEKINEFNINISLKLDNVENKIQKRRVLPKKKAITTSIFDIAKKDEKGTCFVLFGNSLDNCLENDKRLGLVEGSRLSVNSDFGDLDVNIKLSGNVRSCESLPISTGMISDNSNKGIKNSGKNSSSYFSNFTKLSSKQISRSQSDMRRQSNEFDILVESKKITPTEEITSNFNEIVFEERTLQVPSFILTCIKYLEQHGLSKIGLFRVSTSKKRVNQMREDINKNLLTVFPPDTCPHDVATLLKEFLRDLPEPLLCHNLQNAFLETQKIRNRRLQLEAISHLIKLLPTIHRDTLFVLLRFLATVASFSDDNIRNEEGKWIPGNKMDTNNLATVFAPNILRPIDNTNNPHEIVNDAINVIRTMIDHYEELFKVSAELLDVVFSNILELSPEKLYLLCEQRSKMNRAFTTLLNNSSNKHNESSKKFYTRQSLMHDNDASKLVDVTFKASKNAYNKDCQIQKSQFNKIENDSERRKSSPNVFNKSGIVSGSLQIQMPISTTNPQNIMTNSFNHEDDYSRIPFIEDSPDEIEIENKNDCFSISGSLSFSTKNGSASMRDLTSPIYQDKSFDPILETPQYKISTLANEPKLPASISNIGGVILRSKTADFEKKTKRNSINKEKAATVQQSSSMPGLLLYKRQQIIPSAKRPKDINQAITF